jgi:endonuclease YncB( thermonuclease family)
MSPMVRNLAVAGSVVVIVAVGAGAYFATQKPADTGAAAPAGSPPAASPQAAAPQPGPAEAGNSSAQDVATVEFGSLVQPWSLVRDSAAYVQATMDAPQMYPLKAGTPFKSVEKSKDGKWVVAMTQDGQAAFLPAADVGPYDAAQAKQLELPSSLTGEATVVDTGTLTVDGQNVPLAGVHGETGIYADQMQGLIDAQGKQVQCTLKGAAYMCILPNGLDIARTALFNGAAEPGDDASDDYRQQADAAKAAHKGIWK